jgi:putative peptidoglycan lipid II flippase
MLIKVLAPAFYSRKDTRTPVRIAVAALLTNMVLNLVFVVPMVLLHIPAPHAGLALATSLAAWVNAGLLFTVLRRKQIFRPQAGWLRLFLQMGLAGAALGALLLWGVPAVEEWLAWPARSRLAALVVWVLGGVLVYFLALRLGGVRLLTLLRHGHAGD